MAIDVKFYFEDLDIVFPLCWCCPSLNLDVWYGRAAEQISCSLEGSV